MNVDILLEQIHCIILKCPLGQAYIFFDIQILNIFPSYIYSKVKFRISYYVLNTSMSQAINKTNEQIFAQQIKIYEGFSSQTGTFEFIK